MRRSHWLSLVIAALSVLLCVQPSGATVASAACVLDMSVTFSPALTSTSSPSTMSIATTGSTCGGTFIDDGGGINGGPTASTSMNCTAILVGGTGNVNYGSMSPASMTWTYAGNVSGGTFLILPGAAGIVGVVQGVEETKTPQSVAACKLNGASVSSVTFTVALYFVRVI